MTLECDLKFASAGSVIHFYSDSKAHVSPMNNSKITR